MRPTRTSFLSFAFSLAISAFATGIYFLLVLFRMVDLNVRFISIFAFLLFICSFLFSRYILKAYIFEKIKVIYKNIQSLKLTREGKEEVRNKLGDDMIGQVEKDVAEWADHKKAEIEELRRMENYRKEFLANVSHELKTPLSNLQGYISTLISEIDENAEVRKDFLMKSEKNVDRMIELVDELETISRFETGEVQLVKSHFDITQLVQEVFEFLEDSARQNQVRLMFASDNLSPIMAWADRDKIRQALTNLIDNSIKYGREGGRTKVSFYDMAENILIEVSDNGIGIEEQHIPRLFERFYRVDKHRSREKGGSGLGLAIVKHIIEAHEQTVNVRSAPGVGSTFSFTLRKG
jgi:two-component system, OmpR family, phosphate regulon sensor histidine kinase PhoR